MMSSENIAEVEVIYLSYSSNRYIDKPKVRRLETYIAEYEDVEKECLNRRFANTGYGRFCCRQYLWYYKSLRDHFYSARKLKITRWGIRFGDKKAFMKNGKFYREHAYMLGPKEENYFYANPKSLEAYFGTTLNKLNIFTINIKQGFKQRQRRDARPIKSSKLLREATDMLQHGDCSKEFAMIAIAAFRIDHKFEDLDY